MASTSFLVHGVPSKLVVVFFTQPRDGLLLPPGFVSNAIQQPDLLKQQVFGLKPELAHRHGAGVDPRRAVSVIDAGGRVWAKHRHHVQKNRNHPQPKPGAEKDGN